MDRYLITIDGDRILFFNLQKENLKPISIAWECLNCGELIEQYIDSETPTHCYFCET